MMKNAGCLPFDRKVLDLVQTMRNRKNQLINAVENTIIAKGVVDLYPEGADKVKAITDLNTRKFNLTIFIKMYNETFEELANIEKKHGDEINVAIPRFTSAHEVVEIAYRKFIHKD